MKLLFVSPYLPGPPLFGGARRIRGLLGELARDHEVSLLALVDPEGDHTAAVADAQGYCVHVETVADGLHQVTGRAKRLLQLGSLATLRSWESWLYLRPALQRALDQHLSRHAYDVIVCEFAFMALYHFRGRNRPLLVLDEHNVEYDLLRRTAAASSRGRRLFHELNWRKLRHEEVAVWRRFDACTLTSLRDEALARSVVPGLCTAVVPNGVDIEGFRPDPTAQVVPNTLLFFGAINYYPNTDGALYFASEILPLLRAREPAARFRIVGPVGEGPVMDLRDQGVEVVGFVDDVKTEIAQAAVVIVPLRIGGGTRLKILEAMAMGKAIVSTRIGAEGIDVEHEKDILLADTPAEFAQQVSRLLGDPGLRARLGAAARETAVAHYSWRSAAAKMAAFFAELTASSAGSRRAGPAP